MRKYWLRGKPSRFYPNTEETSALNLKGEGEIFIFLPLTPNKLILFPP
ncbi:hypothetical protein OSCI_3460009 [Kamptonema sp. PCC 6506]|nr:hypothetical protein OSCI_3460009 [Kamptonema sp. PCC 6506]